MRRLCLLLAIVVCQVPSIALADGITIIRIARAGDVPPGRPGETFTIFSNPCIDNNGNVAFKGDFDGPASGNEGIYLYSDGAGLQRLVDDSFSFHPPGQSGTASWTGFGPPVLNNSGHVLFHGGFSFGDNEHGLYIFKNGAVKRIFDDNPLQPVPGQVNPAPPVPPGGPGFTTFAFSAAILPLLADSGDAVTTAQFRDSALVERYGMYHGHDDQPLLRVTDSTLPPPGSASPARFSDLGVFTRMAMNGHGDVVFLASIVQGAATKGLFFFNRDTLTLVRLVDDSVTPPDQPSGARFTSFDPIFSVNNADATAFAGSYVLGSGTNGIYLRDAAGGTTTIVDTSGSFNVPGNVGGQFLVLGEPVLNAIGDVVFVATYLRKGGTQSGGVFRSRAGILIPILQLTDPVPGQPGARFTGVGHRIVNAHGHSTLTAQYTNGVGDEGVYFHDDFELRRVIDESQDLLGDSANDFRMMVTVGAGGSGGEDSKPRTLNDQNQITFWARLIDGREAVYRATVGVGCSADVAGPAGGADDVVDEHDLAALLSAWGTCSAPCPPRCAADLDANCSIDVFDLFMLLQAWGACP